MKIKTNKFDFAGSVVLILSLSTFCLSFTMLADFKYVYFGVLLLISVLLLVVLCGIESHAVDPLVSREHLKAPVPAMSMIIALVLSIMAAENIVVPQYF